MNVEERDEGVVSSETTRSSQDAEEVERDLGAAM